MQFKRFWHAILSFTIVFSMIFALAAVAEIREKTTRPGPLIACAEVGIGTAEDSDIVIPSAYMGYPVETIAPSAFKITQ